ncbi:efflux RND transporter periplasmic adaptor subunit [Brevibacillus sp. HD1.4A]|uniref:efflux RND transporter periplasmic adaptor subunit n=1 Tax=Brevibacillus sp. HD1.4A TaxID=2738978 RepID=UPI00156ADE45|nr:efflux RND transporter periplasmic adaptor subunit [Brevibacillus sp. HD1.4A]NRQ52984.1 efflux RND transporter periplasmic adaptor subunit [Brevibacillus sp. HD1.4A]
MNAWIRKAAGSVALLSLVLVGTACTTGEQPASSVETRLDAKVVETKRVQTKTVRTESKLSGTLAPVEEVTVAFEIAGEIKRMPFKEGDSVKKGDVLAVLGTTDYSLQLAMANAEANGANAQLAKVKNGSRKEEVQQAQAAVEAKQISLQQAESDYRRMEQLHKNGAISQSEFERAKNARELAEKDLFQAKATYALVVEGARAEDVNATQASYQGAMAARNQAAATLAKTEAKAPFAGTVLAKMADVGQLAGPGAPVYRIGNIQQLKTVLPVPDKDISSWRAGDEVELALYGNKRKGKVTNIYPATNEQTGTIGVEVVVDNAAKDWFAGQVVSAKRTLEQKAAIFIPTQAVFSRGSEPYVFLLTEGKARKTTVTLGEYVDNELEITAGIAAGDVLITDGADRLLDGDQVTVKGGVKHD